MSQENSDIRNPPDRTIFSPWLFIPFTYSIGIVSQHTHVSEFAIDTNSSPPAECIYSKLWHRNNDRPLSTTGATARPISGSSNSSAVPPLNVPELAVPKSRPGKLSAQDDAKLIFGTIFSLRNMVRKLGGPDDSFISFRTAQYKLHYYETPTNIKFVMLTDTQTPTMRQVLHQIYVNLYVEFGMPPTPLSFLQSADTSQLSRTRCPPSSTLEAKGLQTSSSSWPSTNSLKAFSNV